MDRLTDIETKGHMVPTTASRAQHQNVAFVELEVKLGRVEDITGMLLWGITAVSGPGDRTGLCETHHFLLYYLCTTQQHQHSSTQMHHTQQKLLAN